jgi:hypothetical protein
MQGRPPVGGVGPSLGQDNIVLHDPMAEVIKNLVEKIGSERQLFSGFSATYYRPKGCSDEQE